MHDDTIAALSTPIGKGGIAVLRVSGDDVFNILEIIIEKIPKKIVPQKTYFGFVVKNGHRVDECVFVYYKKPHSYTGEDLAEISIHSNPFIIEEVLNLIFKNGARLAMPGEFTYRAFKNGKMDLIQAESINELINANSKYFAFLKLDGVDGKLSDLIKKVRKNLIGLGIKIETAIEFQEDQFLDDIQIQSEIDGTINTLEQILSHSGLNEVLNKGLNIVIIGKVNVGKSSLFNTLLMEDRAITSHTPGTTRDFLKEKLYVDGFPFEIIDIAGINLKSESAIESEGMKRGLERIEQSDAVIFMLDASVALDELDYEIYERIKKKKRILVANKIDIVNPDVLQQIRSYFTREKICEISAKEGSNIDDIFDFFKNLRKMNINKNIHFSLNQRQKNLLDSLSDKLNQLKSLCGTEIGRGSADVQNTEIIAEEIRAGIDIIGQLTGEISTQEIINGIFSQFCIGK
jgi:tRNA modification GTPase